jgi:hypothetical protein
VIPDPVTSTDRWAHAVLQQGLLDLPLPAEGGSTSRLAGLAAIARADLDLARLAEAHIDAGAICKELGGPWEPACLWAVWAANPPQNPLRAQQTAGGRWQLRGVKPWCSGAGGCERALVTAEAADGYRLFAVEVTDAAVAPVEGSWPTTAMAGSDSRSVRFDAAPARPVGGPGDYLDRAGFWHGAINVASVWWGGAAGVADALAAAHRRRPLHAHALAHLGAIVAALAAGESLLAAAAGRIDAEPADVAGARVLAMQVRAVVEAAAQETLLRAGRALGPAPLVANREHAKRVADLTLYLRQCHAERDLEELGRVVLEPPRGTRATTESSPA